MNMLNAAEVAQCHGITERDLWERVSDGRFPAPDRLYGTSRTPLWDEDTADNPEPRVRQPGQTMSRDQHLTHLYDELVVYALEHKHTDVPQHATGRTGYDGRPFPLGARVSALRIAHSKGRLSASEIARFETLPGWAWDHWDHQWRARFKSVRSRYPHRLTPEDRAWISTQRMRWDKLKPGWQALFDAVPGMIDAIPKSRVDAFLQAARTWLAQNEGKTMADIAYSTTVIVDDGVYALGRGITYYRRRYRGKEGKLKRPLPACEIAQIEELPGWTWEPRRRSAS